MKRILIALTGICLMATLVFALPSQQGTTLTWTPPTQNNNGSPITGLAGYKIYWKSSASGSYTDAQSKDVGNVSSVTIQSVTGSSSAIYYFAATAYNSSGAESGFSNTVRNGVPLAPAVPGTLQVQ
jgi:hypothetical protein